LTRSKVRYQGASHNKPDTGVTVLTHSYDTGVNPDR